MWTPIAGAVFVPADIFVDGGGVVWLLGLGDSPGLSAWRLVLTRVSGICECSSGYVCILERRIELNQKYNKGHCQYGEQAHIQSDGFVSSNKSL
jgi:hypothetical protein